MAARKLSLEFMRAILLARRSSSFSKSNSEFNGELEDEPGSGARTSDFRFCGCELAGKGTLEVCAAAGATTCGNTLLRLSSANASRALTSQLDLFPPAAAGTDSRPSLGSGDGGTTGGKVTLGLREPWVCAGAGGLGGNAEVRWGTSLSTCAEAGAGAWEMVDPLMVTLPSEATGDADARGCGGSRGIDCRLWDEDEDEALILPRTFCIEECRGGTSVEEPGLNETKDSSVSSRSEIIERSTWLGPVGRGPAGGGTAIISDGVSGRKIMFSTACSSRSICA